MSYRLSKEKIESFCGDVLPLYLTDGEGNALYFEDVSFRAEGDAVRIRDFREGSRIPFPGGVLLALENVGEATVYATHAGVEYACAVSVREMEHADENTSFNYYFADMHNHTSLIHDGAQFATRTKDFQDEYIAFIKAEDKMDAMAITDHAGTINHLDFFRGFVEAEKAQPMKTVLFPGAESEVGYKATDRFGTLIRKSGEVVTFGAANYCNSEDWESFYAAFANEKIPVGIFAHPQVVGWSTPGIWDHDFPARYEIPEMRHLICGLEVLNGRTEPYFNEYSYSVALDAGFRLSAAANSDSHGPVWGFGYIKPKTVVMATERSREAILDAYRARRFYATESGNVRLSFQMNGKCAPATLAPTEDYTYRVECSLFFEGDDLPVAGEILSDYGKTVATLSFTDGVAEGSLQSDSARYFYLRLWDKNGLRTFSPPVWTGRAPDARVTFDDLAPMDMTGATATDLSNGADAAAAIDGSANTPYTAGGKAPAILIDLGEEKEIAALGHLPTRVVRPAVNWENWGPDDTAVTVPAHFAVSVSCDGEHFTEVANGVCRVFGSENIVRFAPVCARYVRFDVLDTVGANSHRESIADAPASIGNLALFAKK